MIRYIYIGDQIIQGDNSFAFYDTVTDSFMSFQGEQVFDSVDDFLSYFDGEYDDPERFLRLIPNGKVLDE